MQKSAQINTTAGGAMPRLGQNWLKTLKLGLLAACSLMLAACVNPGTAQLDGAKQSFANGQYQQTISYADAYLAAHPSGTSRAEALYLRGRAIEELDVRSEAEVDRNLAQARYAYQLALREPASAGLQGRIRAGIANTSYHLGDFDTALSQWSQAFSLIDLPEDRPWILYRIGLCQQRLGQFPEADLTFVRVQREYPNSQPALRAKDHQGYRAFYVQLGVYSSASLADRATLTMQKQGITVSRIRNSQSREVLMAGPYANYPTAVAAKAQLAKLYPDALIVP